MALNSLYPDGWFALGAAALKVSSNSIFSDSSVARFSIPKCRLYEKKTYKLLSPWLGEMLNISYIIP